MSVTRTDETFVAANGLTLCYDTFGDRRAKPLVLIMGLGAQMIDWPDAMCTTLAERGHYVVRFDNRDIGRSTRFDGVPVPNPMEMIARRAVGASVSAPYLLADMAADTLGLMDALGLEDANIAGASMGGAIAQQIALTAPARVRTLISIMSTTGAASLPQPKAEAMALLVTPAPTDRAGYVAFRKKSASILRAGSYPDDEAQDEVRALRSFERGLNPPGAGRQLAAIIASGDRTPALAELATPTLVIHGDNDPLIPVEAGMLTARTVPGAKLEIVKGMGHALPSAHWPSLVSTMAAFTR
jgi:pimeloyl-ACP methyl ester carboxylesterase